MKFTIRDLLLVTVIVALAVAWFLDHQKHAKLTEKLTKLADENKQLQIQADLDAIDRAVPSREFEQYKRKTLVESLQSQAPASLMPFVANLAPVGSDVMARYVAFRSAKGRTFAERKPTWGAS